MTQPPINININYCHYKNFEPSEIIANKHFKDPQTCVSYVGDGDSYVWLKLLSTRSKFGRGIAPTDLLF